MDTATTNGKQIKKGIIHIIFSLLLFIFIKYLLIIYKDEVYQKLKQKKAEIETEIENLKESQQKLDEAKALFEETKKEEYNKINAEREKNLAEINAMKDELEENEMKLRNDRETLDEEKRQLQLDRIKYDSDKNELAANLSRFNDLVAQFTVGIDKINEG